jgi:hypothetical protein
MKSAAFKREFIAAAQENSSIGFIKLLETYPDQIREIANIKYNENGDTLLHWAEYQYLLAVTCQKCHVIDHGELRLWLAKQESEGKTYQNTIDAAHLKEFYPEIITNYQSIILTLLANGADPQAENKQKRTPHQFARFNASETSLTNLSIKTKRVLAEGTIANTEIPTLQPERQKIRLDQLPPSMQPPQYRLYDNGKPTPKTTRDREDEEDAVIVPRPVASYEDRRNEYIQLGLNEKTVKRTSRYNLEEFDSLSLSDVQTPSKTTAPTSKNPRSLNYTENSRK